MTFTDRHSGTPEIGLAQPYDAPVRETAWDIPALLLVAGMIAMSIHSVQISIAQLGHVWALGALAFIVIYRTFRISTVEFFALFAFLYIASVLTFFQDYVRVKEIQQLVKFAFFYPCFYFVGRWFGWRFRDRDFPLGYGFLFVFLIIQYLIQALHVPLLFKELDFGGNALHGSFRERNWLAVYFLLFSYILFIKSKSYWRSFPFFGINALVMLLSQSKTAFVACGVAFMVKSKLPIALRVMPVIVGGIFFAIVMASEFTEEKMAVKMEEERGLAFTATMELIEKNPVGYGFGFVEGYFSNTWMSIRGLGEGTNSVFSTPLDLWLIAGVAGLAFWAVFFLGIGTGAFLTLLPIAALTLLNPLHQSELVYFFIGFLVSTAQQERFEKYKLRTGMRTLR